MVLPNNISTTKLIILALLGFCALILGSAVLTLQLSVITIKQQLDLHQLQQYHQNFNHKKANNNKKQRTTTTFTTTDEDYDDVGSSSNNNDNIENNNDNEDEDKIPKTIQSSDHTVINLSKKYPPPDPTSYKLIGESYWNQVVIAIQDWDVMTKKTNLLYYQGGKKATTTSSSSSYNNNATSSSNLYYDPNYVAIFALQQAVKSGHPEAQYLYANSLASGIWPVDNSIFYIDDDNDDSNNNNNNNVKNNNNNNIIRQLHVTEEWIATHPRNQLHESYLNWHMAAMAGHVESSMALAYRKGIDSTGGHIYENDISAKNAASSNQYNPLELCKESLPYFEAAANGIIDILEHDPNSRAKVVPPMDKHILAQVHIHGGTSSQLDWNNKPDESEEALQFYHLKATTSWKNPPKKKRSRGGKGSGNKKASNTKKDNDSHNIDINAAYTLGHLYHYGVRGVPQNLTLSLQYYEIAAVHGHWESAGHAGTMYFWGMGIEQDVETAFDYFKIGAPVGLEGCRRKHDSALKLQQKKAQKMIDKKKGGSSNNDEDNDDEDDDDEEEEDYDVTISECDETSVNGLGLVHLFGIEGQLDVDVIEAEKYFVLAKEMGNVDAMYNLAMMWLGWKTHYKNVEDLDDDGMSILSDAFADDTTAATIKATPGGGSDIGGGGGGEGGANNNNNNKKNLKDYALHKSRNTGMTFKGPLQSDINDAIKLLSVASNKGHLQAKHRLGLIYSQGVKIQTSALNFDAIKPDCNRAKNYYNWVIENAAPSRSKRLRKAYKDFIAGDYESSLRNYLTAAETGSSIGQVNAAFLLERGTCLGLPPKECAKASVRLWKAAAAKGDVEAYLRVGDFYYYGRLRGNELPVGPFAWVQYVLYPEEYLPQLIVDLWAKIQVWYSNYTNEEEKEAVHASSDSGNENEEESSATTNKEEAEGDEDHEKEIVDSDLAMAAHYYQVAVEKYANSRANFNLGFMHEWGLGIAQDFPLAKRHYDLAASSHTKEAELAVQIALILMNTHERFVKWHLAFAEWWEQKKQQGNWNGDGDDDDDDAEPQPDDGDEPSEAPPKSKQSPKPVQRYKVGAPTPPGPSSSTSSNRPPRKTEMDVITSHLFNWSSFVIFVLLYAVYVLNQIRQQRRRA